MKCEKCGFESENNKVVDFDEKKVVLCSICKKFSPFIEDKNEFRKYLNEKINSKELDSFRKFSKITKNAKGMEKRVKEGFVVSKAPLGYYFKDKNLILNPEEKLKVQKIFMDFSNKNISLNKLAEKYNFSVNGIKKVLKNFTYLGKVKFAGQVTEGNHEAIISPELFNKVQSKLEIIERV